MGVENLLAVVGFKQMVRMFHVHWPTQVCVLYPSKFVSLLCAVSHVVHDVCQAGIILFLC